MKLNTRFLLIFGIAQFGLAAVLHSAAAPARTVATPAFELPRLRANSDPKDPKMMARARATVDELVPHGKSGVQRARKQNLDYLEIGGGKSWSSSLHGAPDDTTFVSFLAYASTGTVINVAGAKLIVRPGSKPEHAQLHVGLPSPKGTQWRKFGGPVAFETHGGKLLAALPVLTVRLDPGTKQWDLFVGNRLAVDSLRLADLPKGATKQFHISAGVNGAWVCGLISSDENPLYEDSNGNGVDDNFERQARGGTLLVANAAAGDRKQLTKQWQQAQRSYPVKPLKVQRLLPDDHKPSPPPLKKS